ncbi:hypothetical protein JANAI62_05420 [Jannaschia pagri]|uniref:Putative Flp pilus-assembly TadG-like N-terminal domain-containing protein n=1 Tax=Jannaschia pagri TaxID=2829797 RepID=A0ABQ4NHL3_9RHOB|nr:MULTISPECIES: Tad domain-containing protein [unclassified Jannaschia]GIT89974.1 hypothetical protein JANAI61_04320 [Jannaschia sp. AI_61]GIT93919.1 hypothetical protein JANAI62_05420 [Jannaschia sp. AI_62]
MFRLPKSLTAAHALTTRFYRREDGALAVFGLLILVMMMIAAGVALDMMRSEVDRAHVQSTIDRAVLAAASLDQAADPTEVVQNYLRVNGIDEDSVTITTSVTSQSRRISAQANSDVNTIFMGMLGYDELVVPLSSTAAEDKGDVEVAMVLDISGSMSGSKHTNLQSAAIAFANNIFTTAANENSRAVISVIPYQDSVNLGDEVGTWFPMTMEHTYSRCVIFDTAEAYLTTGIAAGTVLTRVNHFDRHEYSHNYDGTIRRSVCPTDNSRAILPWATNIGTVRDHINALVARAGTAVNLGVKWGAAMLDPSLRPHATQMIADGKLSTTYQNIPADLDDPATTKILIVMSDGKNEEMRDIYPDRKNGPSGVFVYRPDLEVPVLTPVDGTTNSTQGDGHTHGKGHGPGHTHGNGHGPNHTHGNSQQTTGQQTTGIDDIDGASNWSPNWYQNRGRGQDWALNGETYNGYPWWTDADRRNWVDFDGEGEHPDTGQNVEVQYSIWSEQNQMFWVKNPATSTNQATGGEWRSQPAGGTDAIELTFAEFYAAVPVTFGNFWKAGNGDPKIDDATRDFYIRYEGETLASLPRLDRYLQDICRTARESGMLVFTIAFQAPSGAQNDMRQCAGADNPTRFNNVESLDIASAFNDILIAINRLKLTQ